MFGLRPTARIRTQPPGQLALELAEIAEPVKDLMNYDRYTR